MAFMCLTPKASILTNSGLQLDVGPPLAMNCVVDGSRRLPTLTICKRSSLGCVCRPIFPLTTYDKELSLLGKERLVAGL